MVGSTAKLKEITLETTYGSKINVVVVVDVHGQQLQWTFLKSACQIAHILE